MRSVRIIEEFRAPSLSWRSLSVSLLSIRPPHQRPRAYLCGRLSSESDRRMGAWRGLRACMAGWRRRTNVWRKVTSPHGRSGDQ
jgi:hypothetical protein